MPDNAKTYKTTDNHENTCGYIPTYNADGDFTGYKPSKDHKNCLDGYECCSPLHSPPPPDEGSTQGLVFSTCTEKLGEDLLRSQGNAPKASEGRKPAKNKIYVRVPKIHKKDNNLHYLSNKWESSWIQIIEERGWARLELGGWIIFIAHLPNSVPQPMATPVLLGTTQFNRNDVVASVQIAVDVEHAYWLSTSNLYQNNGLATGTLLFDDWIISIYRPLLVAETCCCQ
jgi:hypothetical protein